MTVTGKSVAPAKDLASTPNEKDSTDDGFVDLKFNQRSMSDTHTHSNLYF